MDPAIIDPGPASEPPSAYRRLVIDLGDWPEGAASPAGARSGGAAVVTDEGAGDELTVALGSAAVVVVWREIGPDGAARQRSRELTLAELRGAETPRGPRPPEEPDSPAMRTP